MVGTTVHENSKEIADSRALETRDYKISKTEHLRPCEDTNEAPKRNRYKTHRKSRHLEAVMYI